MRTTAPEADTGLNWHGILDEQRGWMCRVARARLDDDHSAEEIVQEVAVAVLRQNNRPVDEAKVRPWLFQLVTRRIADHFRARYREDDTFEHGQVEESRNALTADAWQWLAAAEDRDMLQSALAELQSDDRQLLIHKYCDGWSYRQLGKHFEMTERAIEHRLVRAKERLRRLLVAMSFDGESP